MATRIIKRRCSASWRDREFICGGSSAPAPGISHRCVAATGVPRESSDGTTPPRAIVEELPLLRGIGHYAIEFKSVAAKKPVGKAVVLQVFSLSKGNNIAGCRVTEGEIRRNGKIRVTRGKDIVYEGEVASLKHEKEDVREIRQGFECGIGLKNFNDVQVGDVVECFTLEKTVSD